MLSNKYFSNFKYFVMQTSILLFYIFCHWKGFIVNLIFSCKTTGARASDHNLTFGSIKTHAIGQTPVKQPVQIFLQSSTLCIILNTSVYNSVVGKEPYVRWLDCIHNIVDVNQEQSWTQHTTLRYPGRHRCFPWSNPIQHHSLWSTREEVRYPFNNPTIKAQMYQLVCYVGLDQKPY